MVNRKIIWTEIADYEMFEILNYYSNRNKSKTYSKKLYKEIQQKIAKLDFAVALPQKTSKKDIFYFVHNHICILFSFQKVAIFIKSVWDERRNPNTIEKFLNKIE